MYDEQNYRFIAKDRIIDLTVNENRILKLLLANKCKIVTYETICMEVYGEKIDNYRKSNILLIMCRIRKKLKGEIKILTKRKTGYYIV